VVIADGDREGTNVVAFWRDKIPEGFTQKPGTKSRRIAGQIRTQISKVYSRCGGVARANNE